MADNIRLQAPTVEQQIVISISGEEKLRTLADTMEKISNGKNLQKYWKTQQQLIKDTTTAYSNFSKKASQSNADELIKVTNALKAVSGKELSTILPDFDKIEKGLIDAKKIVGNIDGDFSVKAFKDAFESFEMLRAYGVDIENLFSHFGVSSNIGELQKNVRSLEEEVSKLTNRLSRAKDINEELRNEFENYKTGSGIADKLNELDDLKYELSSVREQAEETFRQFLKLNNISENGYDQYGNYDNNRFSKYFDNIRSGYLTASDAITTFKSEYAYLLEEGFKENNDAFGIEQLQTFSNKLESIFRQVEETSKKINDIISNGVITKSVENLSTNSSLSSSQRSFFENILKDEDSLKNIESIIKRIIEESNNAPKIDLFNEEQLQQILPIFNNIESHLSSLRKIISDVGDGEEFSPLLKMINNVQSEINNLSEEVSNIKFNVNMDLGSEVSEKLNQKVAQSTSRQLEAYRKLFSAMKSTGKTNKEMFSFYEPEDASISDLIGLYKEMIARAEKQFATTVKVNGRTVKSNAYKDRLGEEYLTYKKEVENATRQLSRAETKKSDSSIFKQLFGGGDLTEVISYLDKIAVKLEEISDAASKFSGIFENGFNVTASVEEIEKLTSRIRELEDELSKIKSTPIDSDGNKSNISSGNQIVESQNKIQDELKETRQEAEKTAEALIEVYRGVQVKGTNGVTNRQHSDSIWSDAAVTYTSSSPDVAALYQIIRDQFSEQEIRLGDGEILKEVISLQNALSLDNGGKTFEEITYWGEATDEAGKKAKATYESLLQILKELQDTYGVLITENAQLYEDNWGNSKYSFSQNGEGFGFSNAKELAEGLSEEKALMPEFIQLIQRYIDAKTSLDSQLESNPMFGKHHIEEFAKMAQQAGYSVVEIKNVIDTFDQLPQDLATDYIIIDPSAIKSVEQYTGALSELTQERLKLAEQGKETNITEVSQMPIEDVFQGETSSAGKLEEEIKNVTSATEKASESAKEYGKVLSQVGLAGMQFDDEGNQIPSKYSYTRQTGKNQVQTITIKYEQDEESGEIVQREYIGEYITGFQALEKEIDKADKKVYELKKNLASNKAKFGDNYDSSALESLVANAENEANMLYEALKKVYDEQSEYEYSIAQYAEERAKKQEEYNTQLKNSKNIEDARAKNASDKKNESDEKKRLANIEQVNRALNKQQIAIDSIEKTYNKSVNPDLDREVSNQQDLVELANKKAQIQAKINSLQGQERTSANEKEFLELEKLIAEYKELAKYKLKSNNPSKQELGGQNLQTLIQTQISLYDKLIIKAEQYGDETADVVKKLKEQRDILSKIDSDNKYTATADDYYASRDIYKVEKASLSAYEAEAKLADAMGRVNEKTQESRREEEKRQQIAQSNAINKALEQEYEERQKNIKAAEKQAEIDRKKFLNFTSSASKKLSSAITKYSNGDTTEATALMKKMNLGVFGDLSDVDGRIRSLTSEIDAVISRLKKGHEQESSALKQEIKLEKDKQNQKDAFNKSNLNAIDLEIKKREEEAKLFSSALKAQMQERESQLSSIQKSIKSYNNDYSSRNNGRPVDPNRSQEYQQLLDKYKASIDALQAKKDELAKQPTISEADLDSVKQMTEAVEENKNALIAMSNAEKGSTEGSRRKEIDKITKYLKDNTRISEEAKTKLKEYLDLLRNGGADVNVDEIHNGFLKVTEAERLAGNEGKRFLDVIRDKAWYGWAAQIASYFSLQDIIRYFKEGATVVKEFDDGLTNISYTMDVTKSQLDGIGQSVLDLSKDLKSSIDDSMQVAKIYANMNTTAEEIKKLSEPTLIMTNLTGFDAATMADDIQAVTQQFEIAAEDSMHIADVYDTVSKSIRVDYAKGIEAIAESVQVAGSTAKMAGLEFEDLAALTGKVVETTRLAGAQVGNGMKTIFTRLSRVGELSDEVDNETLSKASESLHQIGVEVYNADGSYRSFKTIMSELAAKWGDLTDAEKSNISFNIAA